ncbi:hypothetical protein BY458DRAFT_486778 [Sporodiniella umbellata]|nr:hypothetical protein BY458DRAFT_486778 [Sporodiniella umbellata]
MSDRQSKRVIRSPRYRCHVENDGIRCYTVLFTWLVLYGFLDALSDSIPDTITIVSACSFQLRSNHMNRKALTVVEFCVPNKQIKPRKPIKRNSRFQNCCLKLKKKFCKTNYDEIGCVQLFRNIKQRFAGYDPIVSFVSL